MLFPQVSVSSCYFIQVMLTREDDCDNPKHFFKNIKLLIYIFNIKNVLINEI